MDDEGNAVSPDHIFDTLDLINGLERQDPESWAELLRRSESRLRVLLRFRMTAALHAVADDDDVIQDVFIQAMRSIDRFEYSGAGSLHRWLGGILRNKLRELQRAGRRVAVPVSTLAPPSSADEGRLPLFTALHASVTSVSHNTRQLELETKVHAVLARLPELERRAVLLRVYEGLTVREAGEREGVDPSTISLRVKSALSRCAIHLRNERP